MCIPVPADNIEIMGKDKTLSRAIMLYREGNVSDAADIMHHLVAIRYTTKLLLETMSIFWYYKGCIVDYECGDYDQANKVYDMILEGGGQCQDQHHAYIGKGDIRRDQGDLEAAAEWYSKATKTSKIWNQSHIAYYRRGEILEELNEYQQAYDSYTGCLECSGGRGLFVDAKRGQRRCQQALYEASQENSINELAKQIESLRRNGCDIETECPNCFCCPITSQIMTDPVLSIDGYCYERRNLKQWIQDHEISPKSKSKLVLKEIRLISNLSLKGHIWSWVDEKKKETEKTRNCGKTKLKTSSAK